MKLFKKLLAVTLVAVLALTMLAACSGTGETDPDKIIPANDETYQIYNDLNQGAIAKSMAELTYSVKYTKITEQLLNLYLNRSKYTTSEYNDRRDAILDNLEDGVSIVVSEKNVAPVNVTINTSGIKYDSYYAVANYNSADRVGIAFGETTTQRYVLICTFKTKSF